MPATVSGLKELRAYLTRLKTSIPQVVSKEIIGQDALSKNASAAKLMVENVVYSVPPTKNYERTYALLNAVDSGQLESSPPTSAIGIRMEQNAAAIAGRFKEQYTYARHFLPEDEPASFHHYELPRDFLKAWFAFFGKEIPMDVAEAIRRELKRK